MRKDLYWDFYWANDFNIIQDLIYPIKSEWVGVEGHPATKSSLQYLWVDNWLMAFFH